MKSRRINRHCPLCGGDNRHVFIAHDGYNALECFECLIAWKRYDGGWEMVSVRESEIFALIISGAMMVRNEVRV